MRAHDLVLNEIMAELALVVAPLGQDIRTLHVWTQRNQTCDALSRLASGIEIPATLQRASRCSKPILRFRILGEPVAKTKKLQQWRTANKPREPPALALSHVAFTVPDLLLTITACHRGYRIMGALMISGSTTTMQTGATTEGLSSRGLRLQGHNSSVS